MTSCIPANMKKINSNATHNLLNMSQNTPHLAAAHPSSASNVGGNLLG